MNQQIDTSGAAAWGYIAAKNASYLAVANYHDDISHEIKSSIYRFDVSSKQFSLFQQLDTNGASGMTFFKIGSAVYLAVANLRNDSSQNTRSPIYHFDESQGQFVLFQQFNTNGARSWEHFVMNNTHYLAVANWYNDSSYGIKSNIYRLNPACW